MDSPLQAVSPEKKNRRDVRDRYREVCQIRERALKQLQRHEERAARLLQRGGDRAKIDKSLSLADKVQQRLRSIEPLQRRLEKAVLLATSVDRAVTRVVDTLQADHTRTRGAASQGDRERREAERRRKAAVAEEAARQRDHRQAGIDIDPRTAAGRREYEVQNLGGTKRARSLTFKKLLRNKATPERILACDRFDALWHAAQAGRLPPPKFEPGVDGGKIGADLPLGAGAIEALDRLAARLGPEDFERLRGRIIEGLDYATLQRQGVGSARDMSVLFIAALDKAARFFGLMPPHGRG